MRRPQKPKGKDKYWPSFGPKVGPLLVDQPSKGRRRVAGAKQEHQAYSKPGGCNMGVLMDGRVGGAGSCWALL